MFFTIISIFILMYGCINFKKGLIIFITYELFWYSTSVFRISALSLNSTMLLTVGFSVLYLIKKEKNKVCKETFPYAIPFVIAICSYILSSFYAISGFQTEFSRVLNYIFKDYIIIWLLWNTLETEKDFNYLFKAVSVVVFIGCVYGFIEYVLKDNPLLNYKNVLSSNTINIYNSTGLRGYRLSSYFEHPIGAGMVFGLYSIFTIYLWINKRYLPANKLALITAFACIPCIMLTKMRSAILFMLICALVFVNKKIFSKKKFWNIVLLFIIVLPIVIYISKDSLDLLFNMFTADSSSTIGGSSLTMRLSQLDAVKHIMKTSPIFGLGETFRSYITRSVYTDAALGYEGLWFEQAVMHGIFGIGSTILMIYYTVVKIPKKYNSKEACIFALAYWIVYSFSSIPSFRMCYFWLIEFYFIKTSEIYKNMQD